jgi:hypothetical protein
MIERPTSGRETPDNLEPSDKFEDMDLAAWQASADALLYMDLQRDIDSFETFYASLAQQLDMNRVAGNNLVWGSSVIQWAGFAQTHPPEWMLGLCDAYLNSAQNHPYVVAPTSTETAFVDDDHLDRDIPSNKIRKNTPSNTGNPPPPKGKGSKSTRARTVNLTKKGKGGTGARKPTVMQEDEPKAAEGEGMSADESKTAEGEGMNVDRNRVEKRKVVRNQGVQPAQHKVVDDDI